MITLDGTLGITSPAETVQGALTTTGNTILGDATTDTLTVGVTGIVKDASGNVGIGTASPAYKLDVYGTASTLGKFLRNASGSASGGVTIGNNSGSFTTFADTAYTIYDEQNSASRLLITATGLLQFNSGYGSVATAYGCRAWVNFNGTGTVAIRASGNVSSITDNGTGDYTVNFTTAMPDANYASVCNSSRTDTPNGSGNNHTSGTAPATGSIRVIATIPTTATANDQAYFMVAIFR
jgi:hypothetical protein